MPLPNDQGKQDKQTLHIVGLPLHFIFRRLNGKYIKHEKKSKKKRKSQKGDYLYLISAHVESSENAGLRSIGRHLLSNFSAVANYQEGQKVGRDLLNCEPSGMKLLEEQGYVNSVNKNQSMNKDLRVPATEFAAEKKSWHYRVNRFIDSPIFPTMIALLFLVYNVAILAGYLNFEGLPRPTDPIGVVFFPIVFGFVGIECILGPLIFLYSDGRTLFENEKESLWIISMIIGAEMFGVGLILAAAYGVNQLVISIFSIAVYLIFFNFVYLSGFYNSQVRFLVVLLAILSLEVLPFQWFPEALQTVILGNAPLRTSFALATAFVVSLLVGYFFNFMKGVETILEMEHSFALYVGKKGTGRNKMKKTLQKALGTKSKHTGWERFTSLVRVYTGFRPQGAIEFHINLDEKNVKPRKFRGSANVGFYPVKTIYNGSSLTLEVETQSGPTILELEEFETQ